MAECLPSALSLSPREVVLPVVPMFHINAWCIPYAAPIAGCKLVLPGAMLDGASLHGLMEGERVTTSAGVPTIWQSLVAHMQAHGLKLSTLRRTAVGGSALPRALIATLSEDYGIDVRQAWGMTETTGLATMSCLDLAQPGLSADERHAFIARQGRSVFGVECKVVDEQGNTLPRDGASQGELLVRGPWITASYFKSETPILVEGWFPTGDVATIAADGTVQIRDRTKDLIKSGGEWINSIELEAAAMDHPGVAMCAVIAVPSGRWGERPLMFIVPKPGVVADRDALMATLSARVIKSWLPDEIVFLDNLPVGGTGKVQKAELRRRYGGVYG
jgi:fatty-acyl-CoA synthase